MCSLAKYLSSLVEAVAKSQRSSLHESQRGADWAPMALWESRKGPQPLNHWGRLGLLKLGLSLAV